MNVALWLVGTFALGLALMAFCYWFLDRCESI